MAASVRPADPGRYRAIARSAAPGTAFVKSYSELRPRSGQPRHRGPPDRGFNFGIMAAYDYQFRNAGWDEGILWAGLDLGIRF